MTPEHDSILALRILAQKPAMNGERIADEIVFRIRLARRRVAISAIIMSDYAIVEVVGEKPIQGEPMRSSAVNEESKNVDFFK